MYVTIEVRFAEMTGDRYYSERVHSPCKFSKNKARLKKHRKLIY